MKILTVPLRATSPTGFRARAVRIIVALLLFIVTALAGVARASDHLDAPATVANPQADIADVYAGLVGRAASYRVQDEEATGVGKAE